MDIKAIIFDMDGTLIDSLDVWAESDRIFLEELGLPYNTSVSQAMKKMHYNSACDYIKETYSLEMPSEEIGRRIMEIVRDSYMHKIPLKPNVYEYLTAQQKKGIKMCVATSNDKGLAVGALKNLGIYDMMEFVITSDEVGIGKETPAIFIKAAEMLGFEPSETLVLDDSVHAVESAKSGGFIVGGVYGGKFADEFELIKKKADFTITDFGELL